MRDYDTYCFLEESATLVFKMDTTDTIAGPEQDGKIVYPENLRNHPITFMPRGISDDLPLEIIRKAGSNVTLSSNLDFKTSLCYGEGVQILRRTRDEYGNVRVDQVLRSEAPDVFSWLEDNDYNRLILQLINDLRLFSDAYVEYIFDRDSTSHRIAQIKSLETCCSRISKMTDDGQIEWHGYSCDWTQSEYHKVIATPLLSRQYPLYDLKQRMGVLPGKDGKRKPGRNRAFVQMLSLPTSGRFYYSRPYWWSVFDSGWLDFNNDIIKFKKTLINNEMVPKKVVYIKQSFYDSLYASHNCKNDEEKKKTRMDFLKSLDEFLAGKNNAGKSMVVPFDYDRMKGIEMKELIIEEVDKTKKGGDYIEDSEESSNVLCYGMGVHSSILGNSPGKTKTINGTEARELFIIQQALSKYVQQLAVQPLYIVKELNDWPADLEFSIANLQLTTLDANSGATKQIGIAPDVKQPNTDKS